MGNFPEVLKADLSAKFGTNEFKFFRTPVGDNVIEASKESTPALLRYLKEYAGFNFLMDVCALRVINIANVLMLFIICSTAATFHVCV